MSAIEALCWLGFLIAIGAAMLVRVLDDEEDS